MRDVDTLIRGYIEAAAPPVTAEEILAPARGPTAPGATHRRRVWWQSPVAVTVIGAITTLGVIGGVALGVRILTGGGEAAGPGVIDPVPGIAVPVGENPTSVAVVGDAGFVTVGDVSVVRFDPATGAETGRLDLSGWGSLGVYDGQLWLAGEGFRRLDPDRMEVVAAVPDLEPPMAVGHGSIWTTYPGHTADDPRYRADAGSIVLRLDPETMQTTEEISLAAACPAAGDSGVGSLTVAGDAVWVTSECGGGDVTFLRIDPATGEVARVAAVQVGERSQIAVLQLLPVDDRVWATAVEITDSDDTGTLAQGRVYRIGDAEEPALLATVGRWPAAAMYDGSSVWVVDSLDATVTRLDAATGAILGRPVTIGVPTPIGDFDFSDGGFSLPRSIGVWGNTLWVAAYNDGTLIPVYLEAPGASGPATTSFPSSVPVVASTTTEALAPETTSSTETETTETETSSSATSAAVVSREFVAWNAPPDGTHFRESPLPWPISGHVRPEAVVTVNGLPLDVWRPDDQSACADDPDCRRWASNRWFGTTGDPGGIILEEGPNVLVFRADFPDGSSLSEQRTVHYDPTLERITGYLLDIAIATPPRATIEVATLEYGEFGVEQTSDTTTITEFPISDNTVFVVFGRGSESRLGFDVGGISQLAELAAGGAPLEELHYRFTYADGIHTATPWEFLLTPDGQVQQANQLYSP